MAPPGNVTVTAKLKRVEPVIQDHVFKEVSDGDQIGPNEIQTLDLRLLEKAAITFKANTKNNDAEYKWEIVDDSGNAVRTIQGNFANLTPGDHNWIWDGRRSSSQPKAMWELAPLGTYKSRITTKKNGDETVHDAEIELRGVPYNVTIVVTPKNDSDIQDAIEAANLQMFNEYSSINATGQRIHNDCVVKVSRGQEHLGGQVEVGEFDGHMEATSPGSCSTPRSAIGYEGRFYVRDAGHDFRRAVYLYDVGENSKSRIYLNDNCQQPSTGLNYKTAVLIHRGANRWAGIGLSSGCVTIKRNDIGADNDPLNKKKEDNTFLGAVFGGFSHYDKANTTSNQRAQINQNSKDSRIRISVVVESPSESGYDTQHEELICNLETKTNADGKLDLTANPNIKFFLPQTVLRDFCGEKLADDTRGGHVKCRWAIARDTPNGLQIMRTIVGEYRLNNQNIISPIGPQQGNDKYSNCDPGRHTWRWNGKDSSGDDCASGTYKCIIETRFTSPYRTDSDGNPIVDQKTYEEAIEI